MAKVLKQVALFGVIADLHARFDFDEKLPNVLSALGNMKSLEGAPETIQFPPIVPSREDSAMFPVALRTDSL